MEKQKNGLRIDFTIQIKDIIMITLIAISLITGYVKYEQIIEYHIKDKTAHFSLEEKKNLAKMERSIENLTIEVNRLNNLLDQINREKKSN